MGDLQLVQATLPASNQGQCLLEAARQPAEKKSVSGSDLEESGGSGLGATRRAVSERYRHGAHRGNKVTTVKTAVVNGTIDPLSAEMVLDAVFFHGQWRSLNNRLLKALKLAQSCSRPCY